jgi:hypothetical protein
VAEQIYAPSPSVRHSSDIDLLVSPPNFPAAAEALKQAGYNLRSPVRAPKNDAESMVMHLLNAYEFYNRSLNVTVELHHRPQHDPYKFGASFDALLSRTEPLTLGTSTVRVLGELDSALFLCCHGADHAFSRLKWLADLALMPRLKEKAFRHRLLAHAKTLRCEKETALALALLADPSGEHSVSAQRARPSWLEYLIRSARRTMLAEEIPTDLRARSENAIFHFRLANSLSSLGYQALVQLCHPDDVAALGLGVRWKLLYALIGRPLALLRTTAQSGAHVTTT